MSRCRRHGRARRKAGAAGRLNAARIVSLARAQQPGGYCRTIAEILARGIARASLAYRRFRRPRLVLAIAGRLVVRWPGATAAMRSDLLAVLDGPRWFPARWVVVR